MVEELVNFYSSGLRLEGVLSYQEDLKGAPLVLLCPPHPNLGGNMENNVILSLARELGGNGYITLRFNYRGVGGSQSPFKNVAEGFLYWESTFGDGNLEGPLEDTRQALSFLRSVEEGKTLLVGYSFGAVVGIRVGAEDSSVVGLAGIAAPCGAYNLDFLSNCPKPKLFICSDNDFATSVEETKLHFSRFSEPKRLTVKEQVNHFYIGSEKEVAREVRHFFDGILTGVDVSGRENYL